MTSAIHPNFIPNGSRGGFRDSASVRRVQRKAERRFVHRLDLLADDTPNEDAEAEFDLEVQRINARSGHIWNETDPTTDSFYIDPFAGVFQWSDVR